MRTELLFRDDAYLKSCEARVEGVNERGAQAISASASVHSPTRSAPCSLRSRATPASFDSQTGHFNLSPEPSVGPGFSLSAQRGARRNSMSVISGVIPNRNGRSQNPVPVLT